MKLDGKIVNAKELTGGRLLWGAHHPHCDRHNNHLIWIFGHPFCLGCTCMYTGILIGIPISLVINWFVFSLFSWILLHWILLSPTLIQIRVQNKKFKIFSRTLLGITISSYFISGLFFISTPFNALFKILIIMVFLIFYRSIRWLRNRKTKSPCETCPLGYFPTCEWNLPNIIGELENSEFANALETDKLQNLIIEEGVLRS